MGHWFVAGDFCVNSFHMFEDKLAFKYLSSPLVCKRGTYFTHRETCRKIILKILATHFRRQQLPNLQVALQWQWFCKVTGSTRVERLDNEKSRLDGLHFNKGWHVIHQLCHTGFWHKSRNRNCNHILHSFYNISKLHSLFASQCQQWWEKYQIWQTLIESL